MLHGTAKSISSTLTTLFNCSLSQGVVLKDWKMSNITPVPKSGDPSLATNYQPISLLSLVSKVLERLIHSKLLNYILSNDLRSNCQHGFRPGSSTQEALLLATNDWHNLLNFNKQVAVVFVDIHKASDSVPHHLLINSLIDFGVSGHLLTWFKSYLSDRKQWVVLDGESSALIPVTSGFLKDPSLVPSHLLFIWIQSLKSPFHQAPNSSSMLMTFRPVNSHAVWCLLLAEWCQFYTPLDYWAWPSTKYLQISLNANHSFPQPFTNSPHCWWYPPGDSLFY